jgi:hypothetical protein
MDAAAQRAVAYLDVERMDETMFDDPTLIPSRTGARYHIMTINPQTLDYQLSPVGSVLPRFALTKQGNALLVDATVERQRTEASFKATFDPKTGLNVKFKLFGNNDSLFGLFDLDTQTYTSITGPAASLDRFVQTADEKSVYTLKLRLDGAGGDLYRIDLAEKKSTSLSMSLRDIGLLADGKTLVLRERLPALKVETSATISWYRRERYCFSVDGAACSVSIEFQDSKPFQTGPQCTDYHDC